VQICGDGCAVRFVERRDRREWFSCVTASSRIVKRSPRKATETFDIAISCVRPVVVAHDILLREVAGVVTFPPSPSFLLYYHHYWQVSASQPTSSPASFRRGLCDILREVAAVPTRRPPSRPIRVVSVAAAGCAAMQCAGCGRSIEDRVVLSVNDLQWHGDCLQCCQCRQPLTDTCFCRDNRFYCRADYLRCARTFSPSRVHRPTVTSQSLWSRQDRHFVEEIRGRRFIMLFK